MKRFAILTGILSGCLFGMATPFSKILLNGLNSFQLAGFLYLGAAIAMLPQVIRKNSRIRPLFQKGNRTRTAGILFLGGFAGLLLLLAGLKAANASSVSIWLNMEIVAKAIVCVLIFKDSMDRNSSIGVVLTVLAGIIITMGEGSGGLFPALLILSACICWAFDNHLTALTDGASPQSVPFVKGIMAGTVNLSIKAIPMGTILICITSIRMTEFRRAHSPSALPRGKRDQRRPLRNRIPHRRADEEFHYSLSFIQNYTG